MKKLGVFFLSYLGMCFAPVLAQGSIHRQVEIGGELADYVTDL